jgi:hypothetical protein
MSSSSEGKKSYEEVDEWSDVLSACSISGD